MQYTLHDYQSAAVADVLTNLEKAGRRWHDDGDLHSFSLSAVTGAGKTVMAAAVIEALFHGDDVFGHLPDPTATVLWFSDDPSLNEQTRTRLFQASDVLTISDLVSVTNTFNQETFKPGKVYFLNAQKLRQDSLLTRGHVPADPDAAQPPLPDVRPDGRTFTIWDTIRNTVEHGERTLYLVLDEAHRGMGIGTASRDGRATIVKRLINGTDAHPPIPVVWGISATVERFNRAMAEAEGRATLPDVEVDIEAVQESGLLKDTIEARFPVGSGPFDTVLLRQGVQKLKEFTSDWDAYTSEQKDTQRVVPLMVLQLPNTPDPIAIAEAIDTILSEWSELTVDDIAHVLGEHADQTYGPYTVRYVAPERVQGDETIRVLLAKDAISTGWDCPRAEVMVSFRAAVDITHITQLLGRLVRSPLARRIAGNGPLNSVFCLLPSFDTHAVNKVVAAITGGGTDEDPDSNPPIRRVLIDPVDVHPDPDVPDEVWDKLLSLPSTSLPRKVADPVRRLTILGHELARDGIRPDAGKEAHAELHAALDAAATRHRSALEAARDTVVEVTGKALRADVYDGTTTTGTFAAVADHHVIEDRYRKARRIIPADVAKTYAEHLAADADDAEEQLLDAHVTIAALATIPDAVDYLNTEADRLATRWFSEHRHAISGLPDARQEVYRQIRALSTEPQPVDLVKPTVWNVQTTAQTGDDRKPLPRFEHHLMVDDDGMFPHDPNDWEAQVLAAELARSGLVGWYRNPSYATQESLAVSYEVGGKMKAMRPDYIFLHETDSGDITASIVDPHGHHLADAIPKLQGLADYAETHANHYRRIDAVARVDGSFRVLDMTSRTVRDAVRAATDAAGLYTGNHANDYL